MPSDPNSLTRLAELDDAVFDVIAGWDSPRFDRILPGLSQAASYSRIWIGVALVLAAVGGRKGRRTAIEGMAAVGVTSFLANLVLKNVTHRARPQGPVPEERALPKPDSTSFPSGHTASAAAFSMVVGSAYPFLWAPLNVLAGLIGFSRIYTGVHYPGDVLGGWALGRFVGMVTVRTAPRVEECIDRRLHHSDS